MSTCTCEALGERDEEHRCDDWEPIEDDAPDEPAHYPHDPYAAQPKPGDTVEYRR